MAADCIDIADVTGFPIRGCQSISTCCSDEAIEARLEEAVDLIEALTGQWICPRDVCFKVRGNDSRVLFFPPQVIAPAIEIDSISKNDTELTLEFDTFAHFLRADTYCFSCCEYEICGSFGYATVPPALKRAIIILALEFAQPGITGYGRPYGMSRADWGDFSISYRMEEGSQPFGRTTGIRDVDIIIQEYINRAGMFNYVPPYCKEECCNECDSDTGC